MSKPSLAKNMIKLTAGSYEVMPGNIIKQVGKPLYPAEPMGWAEGLAHDARRELAEWRGKLAWAALALAAAGLVGYIVWLA